jgi:hypothetical protein
MERQFSIEAKSFCFSSKVGSPLFRLEERRKSFVGYIFVSSQGSSWLVDTVEVACQVENIAKSFREGDKALMVHGGANKAGRFLEVAVYVEGGWKGGLWLPEGVMDGAGGTLRVNCVVFWLQVEDRSYLGCALRRVRRLYRPRSWRPGSPWIVTSSVLLRRLYGRNLELAMR